MIVYIIIIPSRGGPVKEIHNIICCRHYSSVKVESKLMCSLFKWPYKTLSRMFPCGIYSCSIGCDVATGQFFNAKKESAQGRPIVPCTHPQGDDYKAEIVRCKINASRSPNGSLPEQQVGHMQQYYSNLGATRKPWSPSLYYYALCSMLSCCSSKVFLLAAFPAYPCPNLSFHSKYQPIVILPSAESLF